MDDSPYCLRMASERGSVHTIRCRIDEYWQHDGEHTSLSRTALYIDMSSVALHNFARNIESQPYSFTCSILYLDAGNAEILLENLGVHFRGNANPPITHRDKGLKSHLLQ